MCFIVCSQKGSDSVEEIYFIFSVDHYLEDIQVQCLNNAVGVNAIPTGAHIRDDEQVSICHSL